MSRQLINRSPDLQRLCNEGYKINIVDGHLVLSHVPYVNSKRKVLLGTLVSTLTLSGDTTVKPDTHVVFFAGEYPCNSDGSEIVKIKHQRQRQSLGKNLIVDHSFSSKPLSGYPDYYEKMTTYVRILENQAHVIDPNATARTFVPIEAEDETSPFVYTDTASTRAAISGISSKLGIDSVAIVGLGGTGSYILDAVAKTPIKKILLFDGDKFLQHNAFRSPGAASLKDLQRGLAKVQYFRRIYSRMHRNIVAKNIFLNGENMKLLRNVSFVFLCLDDVEAKKPIVKKLEEFGIPFIDVGMGIIADEDRKLAGLLRVTTSTPKKREHVHSRHRISFESGGGNNEYTQNIQVVDLNMLNAALAVGKWKKLYGFYRDTENEHHSVYAIDGNTVINEDLDEAT